MSLGIGLGAFMQGMGQGINTGRTLVEMRDRAATQNTMREGAETARTARDSEIATRVAGGATQEDAERQVGSFVDYYMRTGAPRVVESLISAGQPDQARAFQTWIRQEGTQRGMRSWGAAIRAAQSGDSEGFGRHVVDAYNNDEYSPDGQSVARHQVLRDAEGNLTGMELTIRGRDGRERTERFNGTTDLYRRAIGFLSPEQQFQHITGELTAARTAQTQAALADRTERRIEAREVRGENRTIRGEVRGEERTLRTEGRAEVRTDARDARQGAQQIDRDNNASWNRMLEEAAKQRGETVQQVQRQIEVIRGNLAASLTPGFNSLTPQQQNERALAIWRDQRGRAAGEVQPRAAAAPTGAVPVYRPPAQGQGLPAR